jgi:hypothetical protein
MLSFPGIQMDKGGTKKGKAVKQLPAVKDMKDKLLTNQREAVSLASFSCFLYLTLSFGLHPLL